MGQIIVQQPNGEEIVVEIAGDSPTQDEQDAITAQFAAPPSKVDLATASLEDIREYARTRRMMGIDPLTGDQITEEEFVDKYKEKDVDYTTGLDSVGGFSRFQFGRMDNDAEKAGYLQRVVGDDGFRTDALGRFILTKAGRNKLGLGEGKELAIDEEGFTFNDVKEFAGATALPIATSIGTSIAASGVGFIPGMLLVGGAAAFGKLVDEGIEYAEGLQKQSFGEVARDSAFEGLFGLAGEGIGRGISSLFGRLIKGPRGLTKEGIDQTEALRAQARELLDKNFRPTVAGGTSESFRPILNRLQAVYEGIFPNEKAALDNLNIVLDDLSKLGVGQRSQVDKLNQAVRQDIKNFYQDGSKTLEAAQKKFNTEITKNIDDIIKGLRSDKEIPENLADMIRVSKKVFDEDMDRLYGAINKELGGSPEMVSFINTNGIKEAFRALTRDVAAEPLDSKLGRTISNLPQFIDPQFANRLRIGLRDASKNPDLIGGAGSEKLVALKKSVEDALDAGLIKQAALNNKSITKPEFRLQPTQDVKAGEALALLQRANDLYSQGMKRFDNVIVNDIIKTAREKGRINLTYVLDNIITPNNAEDLSALLKAIRGMPSEKLLGARTGILDIDEGRRALERRLIGGETIEQIKNRIANLAPTDNARKVLEGRIRNVEAEIAELTTARGSGAEMAEQVRQAIAKRYIERIATQSQVINKETGQRVIDPVKFSSAIDEQGETIKRLFGNELKDLNDVLFVMRRGGADFAPETLNALKQQPLGRGLLRMRQIQEANKARRGDEVLRTLERTSNPDVIADKVFRDVASIRRAKRILKGRVSTVGGRDISTFEAVQDAAMGKILKQIGAATDEFGAVKMTDDFVDAFKTGRLGPRLQKVIRDNYGRQSIDEMFGKGTYDGLDALAEQMIKVSNASITGKGGLAAPQIALALGSVAFIMNPLATATTAAGYAIMSKALRSPKVLKMMMASRRPNTVKEFLEGKFKSSDPIAQGFQTMLALTSAATVRNIQMTTQQAEEEIRPMVNLQKQQLQPTVNQAITNVKNINIPNVQPPANVGSAGGVNPILVPNPVTRATVGSQ
jgi:hypothetical protein